MRLLTFALVAVLLLTPTAASAQDWCDIHPDSPECGDLTEPVIPIIGPPCSSDFEWSCKEFNLFLPAIGVQDAWCVVFGVFDVDLFCCRLCNGFEGGLFSTAKGNRFRWFIVCYCFDILVNWEVLVMLKVGDTVRIVKIDEDEFTLQDKELIGEEFKIKVVEEGFDFPYILDVYGTEIYFAEDEVELVQ